MPGEIRVVSGAVAKARRTEGWRDASPERVARRERRRQAERPAERESEQRTAHPPVLPCAARMRSSTACTVPALLVFLAACSSAAPETGTSEPDSSAAEADSGGTRDGSGGDSGRPQDGTASTDAGDGDSDGVASEGEAGDGGPSNGCAVFGAPGQCIDVTACMSLGDHSSYAGHCPGAANIECCIDTPDTTDNPPLPVGWVLMQQSQVTAAMTTWAVMILDDPATYPMFGTVMMTFGSLLVMARVEWHPADFQNNVVHRGVTLYVQSD